MVLCKQTELCTSLLDKASYLYLYTHTLELEAHRITCKAGFLRATISWFWLFFFFSFLSDTALPKTGGWSVMVLGC